MRPFLAVVCSMALAGGAFLPWIPCLEVVNLESCQSRTLAPGPGGSFSIQYEHSIYDAEVSELYTVAGGKIHLKAVETWHGGVAGYYGFDGAGPRYELTREMPEVVLRVRMGLGRQVLMGKRETQIRELGMPGDRILVRPGFCSVAKVMFRGFPSGGCP